MQLAKGINSTLPLWLQRNITRERDVDLSNYCTLGIVGMSLKTAAPTLIKLTTYKRSEN